MPWSGGVFSRTNGVHTGSTVWAQDNAAGTGIVTTPHDIHDQDLATGINFCLAKDGSNTPTGNLAMGGYKHTGVGAASGSGQYVRYDELVAGYQPLDATITALAGVSTAANQIILETGTDAFSSISFTAQAQALSAKTTYPGMKGLMELSQAVTASGSSLTIDMSLGWNVALTLSHAVTSVAVSNWPATGNLGRLTMEISSGGSYTMSGWPGTTIWSGGAAPTITASGKDTIVLTSSDGGTNFRGYIAAQAMS